LLAELRRVGVYSIASNFSKRPPYSLSPSPLHADHWGQGLFPREPYILRLVRVMKEEKGFC
jgi:hypothetical protein